MSPVRFVILTRDSAAWILLLLTAYRSLGVEPFYIVDARSADDTLDLLRTAGAELRVFDATSDYIEGGMIEFAAAQVGTSADWTFRIDDDEFPSRDLVDWVTRPEKEAAVSWAISRREIIRDGEGLAYSRLWSHFHTPSRPRYLNAHVRLYRHREMAYARTIHTPGFATRTNDFAPEHAYFVHLDALLRDLDERVEKLRRYDRAVPGSSFKFGQHYLPELVPLSAHDPAPLATAEFDDLLAALPIKPEVEHVTLTTAELRAIHAGPFDRDAFDATARQHEAWVEAQARRLRGPASKPLGELCCTLAQLCRPLARSVAPVRRLADRLATFGADLQFRAAARRA